jgi:hypothetical protein
MVEPNPAAAVRGQRLDVFQLIERRACEIHRDIPAIHLSPKTVDDSLYPVAGQ